MSANDALPPNASEETGTTRSLIEDVEGYTRLLLSGYQKQRIGQRKVIHDPILGSNIFDPHEVALIDSPFCQRLRRISQTDVAAMVYPSANHNRLEHSLSVATIAGRMLESLARQQDSPDSGIVTDLSRIEVRCAAILHDIGHGVFSHLSEETFKDFPEVESHRSMNPGRFSPDRPHEMMGHLIIKSPSFKEYFEEDIIKEYGQRGDISLDRIADSIIPAGGKDELFGWQADIINGPFDADKFDYLQRDAYFSGLKIGVDLDRFLHCVWLESRSGRPRQLKIMTSGATTLEQILFGKLMLSSTIYHHQKIRAAECAIKGVFEILKDNAGDSEYRINGRKMDRAIDYLYITEQDVLSLDNKPEELREYIGRYLSRDLFKRALVISADTVAAPDESPGYGQFKSLADNPGELRRLRLDLVGALNGRYSIYDIWVDLPQTLTFEDALFARIQDKDSTQRYLYDAFRVSEWLTAYASNKWKGYVFCPAGTDKRNEVGRAAAELISSKYGFTIKVDEAIQQAKLR